MDTLELHSISVPGRGDFVAISSLDGAALGAILQEHDSTRGPERCLKATPRRRITRVRGAPVGGASGGIPEDVVVKEQLLPWRWRIVHALGWPTRFSREYAKGRQLQGLGIEVPPFLAASSRPRQGASYLVTGYLRGGNLRDRLWRGPGRIEDPAEVEQLLAATGRWLRRLHDSGVWQRDMKPDNIVVREEQGRPWKLALVDIADVRFGSRPLDRARRVRNLGQVLDLPRRFDESARGTLLDAYLDRDEPTNVPAWRRLVDVDIEERRADRLRLRGAHYVDEEPMFRES